MSDRLYVGTRKGLFIYHRHPHASPHWLPSAAVHFLGDPVTMVLPDARDGRLHVALNLGHFGVKVRRSDDGGQTWAESPVPAFPLKPASVDEPDAAWTLAQIWSLEAAGADQPGVLWAGTIPGGLFRSNDRGDSWALVRSLWDRPERREWFGGGYDQPGIHSICVDPRDSRCITIAVSCGGVWQSLDGGETWTCRASGMHAEYMPAERRGDPNIQDVHRLVQCATDPDVMWVQHHSGVYRSVDRAASWRRLVPRPSAFGFAVAAHPQERMTAWFVPADKDERRVPVNAHLVVARTRDGGDSFECLDHGLPRAPAYDLVYRHGLAIDESGRRLAMGSTTGAFWVSEDGGESWTCLSTHLPPIYCVRFGHA